jgi:hypothetical protein
MRRGSAVSFTAMTDSGDLDGGFFFLIEEHAVIATA